MKELLKIIKDFPDDFENNYPGVINAITDYIKFSKAKIKLTKEGDFVVSKENILDFDKSFENILKVLIKTYHKSVRDSKTGLFNFDFFNEMLNIRIKQSLRDKEPLILIMIDIDFFKRINDNYGHLIGDDVLIELSRMLEKSVRTSDVVARFGGEEFIILINNSEIDEIQMITKRIVDNINNSNLLKKYKIKVSGGISWLADGDDSQSLINRADSALYEAKNNGRDRFIVVN